MDEQVQEQLILLVLAAMQGDQLAQQTVQQIMQAAQQGDPQAQQLALVIQQIVKQLQGQQAQAMRLGGVLNYIKFLRGKCPEGYEMQYFKNGGKAGCKKCKKAEEGIKTQSDDIVAEWRCGRKMKKAACGGKTNKISKGGEGLSPSKPSKSSRPRYKQTKTVNKFGDTEYTRTYEGYRPVTYIQPKEGLGIYADHRGRALVAAQDSLRRVYEMGPNPAIDKPIRKKANGGSF